MSRTRHLMVLGAGVLGLLLTCAPMIAVHAEEELIDANGTVCDQRMLDFIDAEAKQESHSDLTRLRHWENARAEYEQDLDNAALDEEQPVSDFTPKRDLIEAKYQLAVAEGRLSVPDFDHQAITDLQKAQGFLGHALKDADAAQKPSFKKIIDKVHAIQQFVSQGGGCWSTRLSDAFDNLDRDVERLLGSQ